MLLARDPAHFSNFKMPGVWEISRATGKIPHDACPAYILPIFWDTWRQLSDLEIEL
jgi:hypothetical protein